MEESLFTKTGIIKFLSKINTEMIAFILLLLLTFQPLYGVFFNINNQTELVALFYGKSMLIRFIGILALVNFFIDYIKNRLLFGRNYFKKTFIKNPAFGLLSILLIWGFISTMISDRRFTAFYGDAYRYEGYLSYIAYAGLVASGSL